MRIVVRALWIATDLVWDSVLHTEYKVGVLHCAEKKALHCTEFAEHRRRVSANK